MTTQESGAKSCGTEVVIVTVDTASIAPFGEAMIDSLRCPTSTSSGVYPAGLRAECRRNSRKSTKYAAGLSTERQSSHWQKSGLPNKRAMLGDCWAMLILAVCGPAREGEKVKTGAEVY